LNIPWPAVLFSLFLSSLTRASADSKKVEQTGGERNIHIEIMSNLRAGTLKELPFTRTVGEASVTQPSEIEREVIGLFARFRRPLLRYVLSLGLSVHDGEEIVQEVFLALFRHLKLRRPRHKLRGWIFCVAHNLAVKQRHANWQSQGARIGDATAAEARTDPSPNPEEQALATQRQRRLLAVLRALPEQDQCCLRLRAEGLRYREIAQVLSMSLGAVSLSLTRSLARLTRADEV
jgi:RNA polymerase sigma-70 factor, ECF subfamily